MVSSFFAISGNIERIGDHADNLAGYTRLLVNKDIHFSPAALSAVGDMRDVALEAISSLLHHEAGDPVWLADVAQMEQRIDDMTDQFRRDQLDRMRSGVCNEEACIIYSELLTQGSFGWRASSFYFCARNCSVRWTSTSHLPGAPDRATP